jgi:polyhydroxybutyrate depolymerase
MMLAVAACSRDADESVDAASSSQPASSSAATNRTGTGTSPSTEPPETGQGSEGCGTAPGPVDDNGQVERTVASSGGARDYLIVVPDGYDPEVPTPLVFTFHGAGSNKEEQLAYSAFAPMADRDTVLLVSPDALGEPRRRWSPYGVATAGIAGVNDLEFFEDLLADVEASFCVDTTRVHATGMSSGGYMTAAIACAYADRVAAAAPVTATMWAEGACGEAAPMPYVYFHGTDDPTVPFLGPVPGPDGEPGPGAAETSAAQWASHNGCDDEPIDEAIGDDVIHRRWDGCDAPTDLYIVEGGGHTWPGAIPIEALGPTTDTISASEIIWDLFQQSSRPQS